MVNLQLALIVLCLFHHNLVKRGNIWYFRFRRGKQVIRKALSTSLLEARSLRDDLLKEISRRPENNIHTSPDDRHPLFKELADKWYRVRSQHIKHSTMRDYQSAMNLYILPHFGDRPISGISYLDIEEFKAGLNCY